MPAGTGCSEERVSLASCPEVADALHAAGFGHVPLVAAGGVVEGRGVAACLALGAGEEAHVARGSVDAVLRAEDGGIGTVRTRVHDELRATAGWPGRYGARGVVNRRWDDHEAGVRKEENRRRYAGAVEKGDWTRLTTYAGTGVGMVKEVKSAAAIVEEVRGEAWRIQMTDMAAEAVKVERLCNGSEVNPFVRSDFIGDSHFNALRYNVLAGAHATSSIADAVDPNNGFSDCISYLQELYERAASRL
ncbi:hypothetical protein MMC18_002251 [Xylographa bjoerkii]|nr:hypothetical protein [Xylographa bjoerkii]